MRHIFNGERCPIGLVYSDETVSPFLVHNQPLLERNLDGSSRLEFLTRFALPFALASIGVGMNYNYMMQTGYYDRGMDNLQIVTTIIAASRIINSSLLTLRNIVPNPLINFLISSFSTASYYAGMGSVGYVPNALIKDSGRSLPEAMRLISSYGLKSLAMNTIYWTFFNILRTEYPETISISQERMLITIALILGLNIVDFALYRWYNYNRYGKAIMQGKFKDPEISVPREEKR